MDDISNKIALVYDYGYNINLARRLSREFGEVLYFKPWKDTEPESIKLSIGEGFQEITRVRHFFDVIDRVDLFIFPDIYDGDLQVHLENCGKRVWGSRMAEKLEYNRPLFSKTLEKVGLSSIPYKVCKGITELANYLGDSENKWVKTNLRGDDETWNHKNIVLSIRKLEAMRHKYGPIGEDIEFTVYDNVDSIIEAAYDGFMVTSRNKEPQFSDMAFLGYEDKNLSHILTAIPYNDFPEAVREVNDKFSPALAEYDFRSAWGTEIKITEDGDNKFLDATCRQPSPPGEIIMEMVSNLGEVFWNGSTGDMVPLDIQDEYGVQVIIYSEWSKTNWHTIEVDKDVDQWVKMSRCCFLDGAYHIAPDRKNTVDPEGNERMCSVVAIGNSIESSIEKVREYCAGINGIYLNEELNSLAECLKRIKEGQEEGIEFTDKPIPEPASVLEGE